MYIMPDEMYLDMSEDTTFRPEVLYRLEDKLIGKEYKKYYRCPHCHKELTLGQTRCMCGVPMYWEGIKEWDSLFAKRKRGKKTC